MLFLFKLYITVFFFVFVSVTTQITNCSTFNGEENNCGSEDQCGYIQNNLCQHISTLTCGDLMNNEIDCKKKSDCIFINSCNYKSSISCSSFANDNDGCLNNGFIKCVNYSVFFFSIFLSFSFFFLFFYFSFFLIWFSMENMVVINIVVNFHVS
jgi:hypothetical protein